MELAKRSARIGNYMIPAFGLLLPELGRMTYNRPSNRTICETILCVCVESILSALAKILNMVKDESF